MLVLTRKQGERIRIGDDIVITVVRTKGKAVRLGIQAPTHVPVLRGEIALAISDEEDRKAAGEDDGEGDGWPPAVRPLPACAAAATDPNLSGVGVPK
jgi:carbon storage regulator